MIENGGSVLLAGVAEIIVFQILGAGGVIDNQGRAISTEPCQINFEIHVVVDIVSDKIDHTTNPETTGERYTDVNQDEDFNGGAAWKIELHRNAAKMVCDNEIAEV